jgi:hypothetical protein
MELHTNAKAFCNYYHKLYMRDQPFDQILQLIRFRILTIKAKGTLPVPLSSDP